VQVLDGDVLAVLGLCDGFVGEAAGEGVDALGDTGVGQDSGAGAQVGELEDVGEGCVGEGERAGVGHGCGHVRDAVVNNAVDDVAGVGVGGGPGGFDAAALVDGDVDNDCALLHLADHGRGDDLGSCGSGDEDAADDEVGFTDGSFDVVGVRSHGEEAAAEDVVEFTEAVEAKVDEGNLGAEAEGHLGGVGADDAAADDADVTGGNARNAAEKYTAAAVLLFEIGRTYLNGEPAGDFGHGSEQGEGSGFVLDGFVGDSGDFFGKQSVGELAQGGKVQVGEEDQVFAEVIILGRGGLFDLDDHVGVAPDVVGFTDDLCANGLIFVVGEGREGSGVVFDEDLVAGVDEGLYTGGGYAYAALVVFHFLGYTDDHLP
jgi:hypothetical protein